MFILLYKQEFIVTCRQVDMCQMAHVVVALIQVKMERVMLGYDVSVFTCNSKFSNEGKIQKKIIVVHKHIPVSLGRQYIMWYQ